MQADSAWAKRLLEKDFPDLCSLPVTPVPHQGRDNHTFRIGREYCMRLPRDAAHAGRVQVEYEWLPKLAPNLPVPIALPVALGNPSEDYGFHWLLVRWVRGRPASRAGVSRRVGFAEDLAGFLKALHLIETKDAPEPGAENFYRGGAFVVYAEDALGLARRHLRGSMADLAKAAILRASESAPPLARVWVHGDFASGNLLVSGGRLAGVIDFGQLAAGDPACDLTVAWTLLSGEARARFQESVGLDRAVWTRTRGWALWKALREADSWRGQKRRQAMRVIRAALEEGGSSTMHFA